LVTMVCLMPFSTIFQLYHDGYTFINGGKKNTRENPTVLSVFTLAKLYQHMQARFGISKNLYWYSCIAIATYCVLTKFSGEELIKHLKYKTQNSPWLDIVRSRGLKHFIL
jgi:hypothetical protein